jgi:hypothetical protein
LRASKKKKPTFESSKKMHQNHVFNFS